MEYNWFSDTRRMISGTKKQVNKFRAPKFIFFKALLPLSLISFLLVILVKRNGTGLVVQRERLRPLSSDSAGLTPNLTRTSDGLTGQTTKPLTFSSQAVSPGEHSPGMSSNSSGLSADLNRTSDSLTGQSTKTLTFSKQSVISSEILPGMSSDAPGLSANLNKPYDGLASSARSVSPGQKSAGGVMNNSASSFPSPDQHTRYNAGQAKKEQKKVAEGQRDPAWRCSTRDAQQEIESLCQLYKSGVVTGDLCSPLCDQGLIQLTDCSGLSFQKKVVKVNCTDVCQDELTVTAFLKTDVINVTKILQKIPNWRGTRGSTDDFQQAVSQLIVKYVKQYLSFLSFNEGEAVKVMWGQDQGHGEGQDQQFLQLEEADAMWRSVSLLMRQSEYVLAKVFEDRKVFPRVYGSCGHFYLQESCPPPKWSKVIPGPEFEHLEEREASWAGRAYGALRTLQFLQHLETTLPDHLIGCDLKPSNFGMCPDGALRMIDINSVYFNSSMTPHIRRNVPCTEDRQCVYMWVMCEGKCDVSTGTCYMENNINLEFTCRGVFMDIENMKYPQTSLDGHGRLLKDPPPAVASDLYRVLNECASLTEILAHEPGARQRVMEQLMNVLRQSLDQASR